MNDFTVSTDSQVAGATGDAPRAFRDVSLLASGLAFVGALLYAVAAWMPWWVALGHPANNPDALLTQLYLDPATVDAPPLGGLLGVQPGLFVWSALTVLGILLAPLLWRTASQPVRRAALIAYIVWLALITALTCYLATVPMRFGSGTLRRLPLLSLGTNVYLYSARYSGGFWLAVVALVLAWLLPLALLARRWWRRGAPVRTNTLARAVESSGSMAGAGVLTGGILLWEAGTVLMPWASARCASMPLFLGTCVGLPFSGVLGYALTGTHVFDPMAALYAIGILLTGGALLILAGLWRGPGSWAFFATVTLWLVAATLFAILGYAGVVVVATGYARISLPGTSWRGTTGVLVTGVALLICWIGDVVLGVRVLRRRNGLDA